MVECLPMVLFCFGIIKLYHAKNPSAFLSRWVLCFSCTFSVQPLFIFNIKNLRRKTESAHGLHAGCPIIRPIEVLVVNSALLFGGLFLFAAQLRICKAYFHFTILPGNVQYGNRRKSAAFFVLCPYSTEKEIYFIRLSLIFETPVTLFPKARLCRAPIYICAASAAHLHLSLTTFFPNEKNRLRTAGPKIFPLTFYPQRFSADKETD